MISRIYISFFLVLLSVSPLFSQQTIADSLKTELKKKLPDSVKVKHYNDISWEYFITGGFDTCLIYAEKALSLAQKINYSKGEATAYSYIGHCRLYQGFLPEALKNYFSSLKLIEQRKDKQAISTMYNNIGNVYYTQKDYQKALSYFNQSLRLKKEINDDYGIATSLTNIANVYNDQQKLNEALKLYKQALEICISVKNYIGIITIYNNIGNIHYFRKEFDSAQASYDSSLALSQQLDYAQGKSIAYNNLGKLFMHVGKNQDAYEYLNNGLKLSLEISSMESVMNSYLGLAQVDSAMLNFSAAYNHYKLYILYRDSLVNDDNTKKVVQQQMQYEFEKKEATVKANQDKKDALAKADKERQAMILWMISGVLILVLLFSIVLFRNLSIARKQKQLIERQKTVVEEQKLIVEEKQKEIIDSIKYAQRIQRAIVTSERYIAKEIARLNSN